MTSPKSHHANVSKSRITAKLGHDLECRLRSYIGGAMGMSKSWDKATLAASAVGIAGLALMAPMPTEAEIVYTPENKVLFRQHAGVSQFILDVNNDGQGDFFLQVGRGSNFSSGVFAIYGAAAAFGVNGSNQVMTVNSDRQQWDADLRLGVEIGPGAAFGQPDRMATCAVFTHSSFSSGPWRNITNRYLGLKFVVDGETHYGWARLSLTGDCGEYSLRLTGYAYETVSDQPIAAGVLPFANDAELSPMAPVPSSPEPATLGALATGAA